MYSRVETITPEIAAEYLKHNVTDGERRNRRMKPMAVYRYADDMKNGRWQLTPQGIAFFENGVLSDGQHRLEAIIVAGVPVQMNVTYDVPNESTIFDRGVARSTGDVFVMTGKSGPAYGTNGIAAARFLFRYANKQNTSEGALMAFIDDNAEKLGSAVNATLRGRGKRNGFSASGKGCIIASSFCALYCGIEEDELAKFFTSVNTGFVDSSDERAAIVLRNYLIQGYHESWATRKEAFMISTNAIKDYADKIPRSKKYRSDTAPAFWSWTKKLIDSYK